MHSLFHWRFKPLTSWTPETRITILILFYTGYQIIILSTRKPKEAMDPDVHYSLVFRNFKRPKESTFWIHSSDSKYLSKYCSHTPKIKMVCKQTVKIVHRESMRMFRKQQIRNQYTNQDKTDLNKPNMRSYRWKNVHQRHMKERASAKCERIAQ